MTSLLILASEGFGLNLNLFETNIINLTVVIFGLYKFLPNFLGGMLERRRAAILLDLQDAENRLTEAKASLASAKKDLADVKRLIESAVCACVRLFVRACVCLFVRACVRALVPACVRNDHLKAEGLRRTSYSCMSIHMLKHMSVHMSRWYEKNTVNRAHQTTDFLLYIRATSPRQLNISHFAFSHPVRIKYLFKDVASSQPHFFKFAQQSY